MPLFYLSNTQGYLLFILCFYFFSLILLLVPLSHPFFLRDLFSSSNSLFCGLFFQMMPIKGKGKVSKQTNKLESIVSGAFSVGLLAAEPFFVYRVLMISKQRISKQTENWGVYLIHLMYCFYWKGKLRLTWRHSSVQCQICYRSNTSPDCLSLKFLRVGSAVWAACWVVESVCGVSDVNHHQSSSCLKTIIDKILWELSLILKCKQKETQIPGVVWWTWKKK